MKEITKENSSQEKPFQDECCNIAESMMEEIHQIMIPDNALMPYINNENARAKGFFKKKASEANKASKNLIHGGIKRHNHLCPISVL